MATKLKFIIPSPAFVERIVVKIWLTHQWIYGLCRAHVRSGKNYDQLATTAGFIWYEMVTMGWGGEDPPQVSGFRAFATVKFWTCSIIVFGEMVGYPTPWSVIFGLTLNSSQKKKKPKGGIFFHLTLSHPQRYPCLISLTLRFLCLSFSIYTVKPEYQMPPRDFKVRMLCT